MLNFCFYKKSDLRSSTVVKHIGIITFKPRKTSFHNIDQIK